MRPHQDRRRQLVTADLRHKRLFVPTRSEGDDVAVMDDGMVVHTGLMADLAADEALQTRLLGLSLMSHQ